MKRKSIAVVGAAETTELGLIPNLVTDPTPRRRGAQRDGRRGAEALRHRRPRHALPNGRRTWPITSASPRPGWTARWWADARSCCTCATPRRQSTRGCAIRCSSPTAKAAARASASAPLQEIAPAWRVSSKSPFGIAGPTSTFTIPVLRYMKNLRHQRGAARDGRRGPARMGGQKSARDDEGPDHRRRRAQARA